MLILLQIFTEVPFFSGAGVLQVQKAFSQRALFSGLTPGRLYRFAVRTEKESFTDSSPVTVNITTGKHTHSSAQPSIFLC